MLMNPANRLARLHYLPSHFRQIGPGDHVLCMSNGGFGGVHGKLLQALKGVTSA